MRKYLGNCQTVDWQAFVDKLKASEPMYQGPRHVGKDNIQGASEIEKMMRSAGYKLISEGGNLGWDMYSVPDDIVYKFEDFVKADKLSCWVSSVHPGNLAPWHWDTQDKEEELEKIDYKIIRVHCHMEDTKPGHILIVEDELYYNVSQGDVFEWPTRTSWHAGANCGLEPKFIFNFFGIRR